MLIQLSSMLWMELNCKEVSSVLIGSHAQTLAWERSALYIFMFICTSVIVKSMQRVETCRCVPEDRNPLVYFPLPLLSFERFTSLNPVSQHNHGLLAPPLFFRTHFGRSSCDLHGNGREMRISLSKEGKQKQKEDKIWQLEGAATWWRQFAPWFCIYR